MKLRTYKNKIIILEENQVFCFGSNPVGINGNLKTNAGGAALFALKNGWVVQGEKMNNCLSKSGKAWGLVTISFPGKKKSKTLDEISFNVKKLYEYAENNPDKEFLVAYTGKSNYNLNGYSNNQLASCFSRFNIPINMIFEEEFSTLLQKSS